MDQRGKRSNNTASSEYEIITLSIFEITSSLVQIIRHTKPITISYAFRDPARFCIYLRYLIVLLLEAQPSNSSIIVFTLEAQYTVCCLITTQKVILCLILIASLPHRTWYPESLLRSGNCLVFASSSSPSAFSPFRRRTAPATFPTRDRESPVSAGCASASVHRERGIRRADK